ncbi:hypothetical protein [Salinispora tropica]|nr:hypothetical protein [Salinispora tropica]
MRQGQDGAATAQAAEESFITPVRGSLSGIIALSVLGARSAG